MKRCLHVAVLQSDDTFVCATCAATLTYVLDGSYGALLAPGEELVRPPPPPPRITAALYAERTKRPAERELPRRCRTASCGRRVDGDEPHCGWHRGPTHEPETVFYEPAPFGRAGIYEGRTCDAYDQIDGIVCPNPATRLAWEIRDGKASQRLYFCEDCLVRAHMDPELVSDPIEMEPDDDDRRLMWGLRQPDILGVRDY